MTRSAFISSCSDPFLALLMYKLFKKHWYDEITTFYININNHCGVPQEVVSELLAKLSLDKKINIIYHPSGIGNGMPITEMTKVSSDELVLLLEDDFFIYTPGMVNKYFQMIESDLTDAVGSPRMSCAVEIAEVQRIKYGLDYSGLGDKGPHFWPAGFFCKRKDLLRTDLNFGSIQFKAGDYCKELDYTFKEVAHGDTFVWACIQLRALGLRFTNVPQFHADPYEIENKEKQEMNWINGIPFWLHGGSLSAGWNGYLSGQKPDIQCEINEREMETRCALWQIASDVIEGFDEFKVQYKKGIEELIINSSLSRGRIKQKYSLYRGLLNV